MPSRVTAVARYAFGSTIVVPACRARVRPRNASCTMSSASPTDPVIPSPIENSSGRYAASAAPASSADPDTEPLPPAAIPRLPAELFLCPLVRVPARAGHLGHDELAGEQPPEPGGHPPRRLRAQYLRQVGQPLGDRRRVTVHHVVYARRAAADRGERRGRGVSDLDERPDPCPAADHRHLPLPHRLHQEVPGARPVEPAIAQHEAPRPRHAPARPPPVPAPAPSSPHARSPPALA